jgi:hypothetical protein
MYLTGSCHRRTHLGQNDEGMQNFDLVHKYELFVELLS